MNLVEESMVVYVEYETAYEIDCVVGSKKMVAFILGEYKIPFVNAYKISFSNEHQGIFVEINAGKWVEQNNDEQLYSNCICKELTSFHENYMLHKIIYNAL